MTDSDSDLRPRIVLIYGGMSSEHAVAVRGAKSVAPALAAAATDGRELWLAHMRLDGRVHCCVASRAQGDDGALDPELVQTVAPEARDLAGLFRRGDVVFPLLHGPYGEDGRLQGMLDMLGCSYVGSGVLASAACMDKVVFKRQMLGSTAGLDRVPEGLAVLPWRVHDTRHGVDHDRISQLCADVAREVGWPCFVKPANLGSSVGISRVEHGDQLPAALELAAKHDSKILIERGLDGPREIEFAVLGDGGPDTIVSPPGEILLPAGRWYDYEAKYESNVAQLKIPAELPPERVAALQSACKSVFSDFGCRGLARIDFMIDRADDRVWLNEINTMPGFTSVSMYAMMMGAAGIAFNDLVRRLVELAVSDQG